MKENVDKYAFEDDKKQGHISTKIENELNVRKAGVGGYKIPQSVVERQ